MMRGLVVAALGAGAVVPVLVVGAPNAVADPCPDGTARVFLGNSTNSCQGAGTVSYTDAPVSKVCSMTGSDVVVDIEGNSKKTHRHVELTNGQCAQFDIRTQMANTVTVTPR